MEHAQGQRFRHNSFDFIALLEQYFTRIGIILQGLVSESFY
jgi:hypothetical protein